MDKTIRLFNLFIEKYSKLFFATVIVMYAFTAYKSSGFHQPDEHFQVIEFAKYKMGETKASELAWEFAAEIRSALQPAICFLVFKALRTVHIDDPYSTAFVLRLISALFAVYVLYRYTRSQSVKVKKGFYGLFVFLTFFFWIVPYVSVRFSSEAWSGLFFLLGIVQLQGVSRYRFLFIGLLLGIAVLLRYQSAVMVGGLMLWLMMVEKVGLRRMLELVLGVLLVMAAGFLVDMWFYGKVTFTAYNYFWINIVEDVASNFGTSPWYAYLVYLFENLTYPVGVFVFLSLLYMVVFRWKEKEVWIIVPFILIHSLIPHKEPRFLFPIVFYGGFILTCFIQYLYSLPNKNVRKITSLSLAVVLFFNMLGLVVVSSKAAGNGKNAVGSFIHNRYQGKKVNVIYMTGLHSYRDWPFVRNTFYRNELLQLKRVTTIWQDDFTDAIDTGAVNLLMLSDNDITGPRSAKKIEELQFRPIFQSIPELSRFLINLYDTNNNDNLYLYEWQGK